MPLFSLKLAETLAATCGASIPGSVRGKLAAFPEEDKKSSAEFGIDFAERQCRELLAAGVPGILFYTMNRWDSVSEIVRRLRASGRLPERRRL
jgi:methylenetetrahydrofolate reductase (NADPH)